MKKVLIIILAMIIIFSGMNITMAFNQGRYNYVATGNDGALCIRDFKNLNYYNLSFLCQIKIQNVGTNSSDKFFIRVEDNKLKYWSVVNSNIKVYYIYLRNKDGDGTLLRYNDGALHNIYGGIMEIKSGKPIEEVIFYYQESAVR